MRHLPRVIAIHQLTNTKIVTFSDCMNFALTWLFIRATRPVTLSAGLTVGQTASLTRTWGKAALLVGGMLWQRITRSVSMHWSVRVTVSQYQNDDSHRDVNQQHGSQHAHLQHGDQTVSGTGYPYAERVLRQSFRSDSQKDHNMRNGVDMKIKTRGFLGDRWGYIRFRCRYRGQHAYPK